jgi:hypothetical protein
MMRAVTSLITPGLLLLALTVAACQPTSSKSTASAAAVVPPSSADQSANPPKSTLRHGDWVSTGIFDSRLETATQKIMSNALNACMGSGGSGLMECVTDKFALALDPSGGAKDHCSGQPDADAKFQCFFSGTVIKTLRAKSGTEMTDSAWENYEKAMQQELLAMSIQESFSCAKLHGPKGPDYRQCMSESILDNMDANPEMGQPCLALEPDEKFGQCVGEAGMVSLLEAAAARAI